MKMNNILGWFSGLHQTETIKLLWKYNHPEVAEINKAIDHFEKLLLMANLMK